MAQLFEYSRLRRQLDALVDEALDAFALIFLKGGQQALVDGHHGSPKVVLR